MSFLRKLYYFLPPSSRLLARRLVFLPEDLLNSISGKRDKLVPPRGMIYTGSGDFVRQGDEMLQNFIKHGQLKPTHHVLDIGSGIGRIARPLTAYLSTESKYEGFDVVEQGVTWCKENISKAFPNFNFTYIPLENDLYTSKGMDASNFMFPYEDQQFDFVILTSVFTHMVPEEVENYMKEISRVLKPGGCCFASFFIINETSKQLMAKNPAFNFPYDKGHYYLMDEQVQSANVAFTEQYVHNTLIPSDQLELVKTVYGYWSGRDKMEYKDFQDLLIIRKHR